MWHCCQHRALLKGGEHPEEGDDEDTEGLSHTENKRFQRDHPLPRRLVHACYGRTFEEQRKNTILLRFIVWVELERNDVMPQNVLYKQEVELSNE